MGDSDDPQRRLREHGLGPPFPGRPDSMPVDVEMAGYDLALDQLLCALIELLIRRGVLSTSDMYWLVETAKARIPIDDLVDANAHGVLTEIHADLINDTADLDPGLLRRLERRPEEKFPDVARRAAGHVATDLGERSRVRKRKPDLGGQD